MARLITLSDVLNAARAIHDAWSKWQSLDGPMVAHNGTMTKGISEELQKAMLESVDATADEVDGEIRDVAPEARRLQLLLDEIGYAYRKWHQDYSHGISTARPIGSDAMLNAWNRLHDAMQTRKLPLPPPMASLVAMGAPHSQIALKYGWKGDEGAPDMMKVAEEIAVPGTHYDPKTWVHPAEAAITKETDRQWATRKPRPTLFHDDSAKAPKPVIRSVEELIQAHAPAGQIARLHKLEEDEVNEIAKRMGIDLSEPREIKPANEATMQHEIIAQNESRAAAGARAAKPRGK